MPFIREKITTLDQEKILRDAKHDSEKDKYLLARGGHFNTEPDLAWVINRENDSYLFLGPRLGDLSEFTYFFYFNKKFYFLLIKGFTGTIKFSALSETPSSSAIDEFRREAKLALVAYGPLGGGVESAPHFDPAFEGEA